MINSSNGNVGIGTTDTFDYKLAVNGSGYFSGYVLSESIRVKTTGGYWQGGWKWADYTGARTLRIGGIDADKWYPVQFFSNGIVAYEIDGSQNHDFKNGTATFGNSVTIDNNNYLYLKGETYISSIRTTSSGYMNFTPASSVFQIGFDSGNDDYVRIYDASNLQKVLISTNGNSYFNGGNIGIGTNTPSNKLEVSGTTAIHGILTILGNPSINNASRIILSTTAPNEDNSIFFRDEGSNTAAIRYKNSSDVLEVYGMGNETLMSYWGADGSFINNGNVGIGTTDTFGYKLAVNGTIGAKEVIVETTSSWPDYVFNEEYELASLDEVEAYAKENKHLPDVPTQEEIQENGLDLGKMNAVLLQKIEELTLYIIDQQKQNQEQQQQIQILSSEIKELQRNINHK